MDNGKKSFRPNPNRPGNGRRNYKTFGFVALIVLFGLIIYAAYGQSSTIKDIPLTQAISENNKGKYSKIEVDGNKVLITPKGQSKATLQSFKDPNTNLKEEGFDTSRAEVSFKQESSGSTVGTLLITLLPVVLIIGALFFLMRSAQGQGNQALSVESEVLGTTLLGFGQIYERRLILELLQIERDAHPESG